MVQAPDVTLHTYPPQNCNHTIHTAAAVASTCNVTTPNALLQLT